MSGSDFPIRRIGEGRKSGLNERRQADLALKSNEIAKRRRKMSKFMYLFRGNHATYQSMSPEQMQQNLKNWMDWKDNLEKNGHINLLGERLDGTGKVVRGKTKSVIDGPYVEVKDFVQGYMLVEAKDMDQAVELAKG